MVVDAKKLISWSELGECRLERFCMKEVDAAILCWTDEALVELGSKNEMCSVKNKQGEMQDQSVQHGIIMLCLSTSIILIIMKMEIELRWNTPSRHSFDDLLFSICKLRKLR